MNDDGKVQSGQRVGRNAPSLDEQQRLELYDRVRAVLFQRGYCADDFADALGEPVSRISHLRANLQHYSLGRRQAADRLLSRFFAWAVKTLEATPDLGSTANTAPYTLGRHLRAQLGRPHRQ